MEGCARGRERGTACSNDGSEARIKRIAETDVSYHSALEEGKRTDTLRAIDDLIWDHKVPRGNLFLQASYRRESDDCSHTDVSQGGDVGLVFHFVRGQLVGKAVAGYEGDWDFFARCGWGGMVEDGDGGGRQAPGRFDCEGCGVREAGEGLDSCSAYYGDVDGGCGESVCIFVVLSRERKCLGGESEGG